MAKINEDKSAMNMKHVDLTMPGIAYTVVDSFDKSWNRICDYSDNDPTPKIESILRHGLLGSTWDDRRNEIRVTPSRWYDNARRDKKRTQVFFNITGRGREPARDDYRTDLLASYYTGCAGRVAFTFDLSNFVEELAPASVRKEMTQEDAWKRRTNRIWNRWFDNIRGSCKMWYFQVAGPGGPPDHFLSSDAAGVVTVSTEYGFTLHPRVAPRHLTSIVLTGYDRDKRPSPWKVYTSAELDAVRLLESRVEKVVSAMHDTHEKTGGRSPILPIYEADGTRLWPK